MMPRHHAERADKADYMGLTLIVSIFVVFIAIAVAHCLAGITR